MVLQVTSPYVKPIRLVLLHIIMPIENIGFVCRTSHGFEQYAGSQTLYGAGARNELRVTKSSIEFMQSYRLTKQSP